MKLAGLDFIYQLNIYLNVDAVFAILEQLISFKIIELNRVLIFFHGFFRINVELNFDFKFWSGIISQAFKKLAA